MADDEVRVQIPSDDGPAPAKDLDRAIAEERRRAEEANRRAAQYRAEAAQARQYVAQQQAANVANGIDAVRAEAESAKRDFEEAMNMGAFDRAAECQATIAAAEVRAQRLQEHQAYLQSAPQQPRTTGDPVEDYISQRSGPTQSWLRAHREWVTDPRKNAKLTSAHYAAVAEGLTPDTDQYFAAVESRLGLRRDAKGEGAYKPNDPRTHVRSDGAIHLTHGEAERATDGSLTWQKHDVKAGRCDPSQVGEPIGHREYAPRKRELLRAGAYNRLD
jgi:hypothetical protein